MDNNRIYVFLFIINLYYNQITNNHKIYVSQVFKTIELWLLNLTSQKKTILCIVIFLVGRWLCTRVNQSTQ